MGVLCRTWALNFAYPDEPGTKPIPPNPADPKFDSTGFPGEIDYC